MTQAELETALLSAEFSGGEETGAERRKAVEIAVFRLRRVSELIERLEQKKAIYEKFESGKYRHGFCACISFVERFLAGEEN